MDPRFALLLALMDDSGARSKALRTVMRSAVDCPLELPPTPEQAPFGWIVFPALKGQRAPLHLLTAFERRELEVALGGYLRELEAGWLTLAMDYPLFPGARLGDRDEKVVSVSRANAFRHAAYTTCRLWLREAEKKAGVEHVEGLAFHGIRRVVSDLMYEELGLDAMTTAMAWSTRSTPEQIYVDRLRMGDRVMAREAMEKKRGGKEAKEEKL